MILKGLTIIQAEPFLFCLCGRKARQNYTSNKQTNILLTYGLFSDFAVMRLTKPTLFTNIPVTCEERDLPGMSSVLTYYCVHIARFNHCKCLRLRYQRSLVISWRKQPETARYFVWRQLQENAQVHCTTLDLEL